MIEGLDNPDNNPDEVDEPNDESSDPEIGRAANQILSSPGYEDEPTHNEKNP